MMRLIVICFILLFSFGCNSLMISHRVERPNDPLDGTFGNKKFNSNDVKYVQGNLAYLTDRKKRNNKLYFASANHYNDLNYKIANDYIREYKKLLKVDAKELENGLKNNQYGVKGSDILRKMENGTLPVYPVRDNVNEVQKLKDEENRIAFPDYIGQFLDVYVDEINEQRKEQTTNYENKDTSSMLAIKTQNRDEYVRTYLELFGASSNNNLKTYKEKPL